VTLEILVTMSRIKLALATGSFLAYSISKDAL
jgi:hypothetical protein